MHASPAALTYFGIVKSITSWAKVARELLAASVRLGAEVEVYERRGFLYDESFTLPEELSGRMTNSLEGKTVVTFEHPRTYQYLAPASQRIGLLVYEFTRLPDLWVERITTHLDLVIVPSEFCRKVFLESGVPEDKVAVLRYGYNPKYYYPRTITAPRDRTAFLCVTSPHRREGVEFLLEAFSEAFSGRDAVELVLKFSYWPGARPKPFEYPDLPGMLERFKRKTVSGPRLRIITDRLREAAMGDLYRSADCYVSLTRGEAFGLCFLEAFACGLPVIAMSWSGHADFLHAGESALVDFTLVATDGEEYEAAPKDQQIALPDVHHAAGLLREFYERRSSREGPVPFDLEGYWHWETIAREFLDRGVPQSSEGEGGTATGLSERTEGG